MDIATLVQFIIQDHPDFLDVATLPSFTFRSTDKEPLVNTNWMLESNKNTANYKQFAYDGLDGMKTGFTDSAGYCFAGTAERDGMRLISVVMGTESMTKRFTETKKVLDYGFNHFEVRRVVASNGAAIGVESVPVKKGLKTEVSVVTDQAVDFVVPKGIDVPQLSYKPHIEGEALIAPFQAGTIAGTMTYTYIIDGMDAAQVKTVNLIAAEQMEKAGWFRLMFRSLWEGMSSLLSGRM